MAKQKAQTNTQFLTDGETKIADKNKMFKRQHKHKMLWIWKNTNRLQMFNRQISDKKWQNLNC